MTAKTFRKYSNLSTRVEQTRGLNLRTELIHSDIARTKEATEAEVKLAGLRDYYEMRRGWNMFLKMCLLIILVFNIFLVLVVGRGWLKFEDEWFLRIVLTTNLADIIGLVYLVVKFLFSNQTDISDKEVPKNSSDKEKP